VDNELVLTRLVEWFRSIRRPPTADQLEAREEAQEILDQKDTIRILDRFGPEGFTTDIGLDKDH
jgi:hypothetical protein